ncbi:MAG: PAS domain-containing protein [Reichenbachiella sp.]|uniref:PAS domain-containing protein n=1 Tax=Reichenbachiella sp. TaxID=2184521 RepID=UPI00329724A6
MAKSSEEILEGVLGAINELTENHNLNQALDQAVQLVGETFNSDCFLSRITFENKKWISNIHHTWMKVPNQNRVSQNQNLVINAFGDIGERLNAGEVVSLKYNDAKKPLKKHFDETGGKSVLLVPIRIEEQLWGTLAMADLEDEREWPKTVKATLDSLARIISSKVSTKAYKVGLKSKIKSRTKALLNQNERYLSLIENVPGIIFRCRNDEHWSMEFISSYVKTITGYEPIDFLDHKNGIHFNHIIHESDKLMAREDVQAQLTSGTHYRTTYRIITKDHEIKWLWEQGIQIIDEGKEYLEGCIIDISDRVNGHERVLAATLEAEERERSRISRNIHDNLQQLLITAHLNLIFLKKRKADFSDKEISKYEIANDYLQKAIEESRSLSHKLMPKAIEDYGFEAAVEGLIENIDDVVDTKFQFYNNLNGKHLSAKVELCLFRITQEAMSNIIKFAQAKNATIQLMKHQDSIVLTIEDDGIGFDKSRVTLNAESFGINSMKNRTSSVGGQFFLDSQVGKGTQLMVEIPN